MSREDVQDDVPPGFTLHHTFYSSNKINRIAWSPDGKVLASATRGEAIHLWDSNAGNILHTFKGKFNYSIAWSPDGNMLASGDIFTLFLWDTRTGELHLRLRTPAKSNKSIAWSPDGGTIASGSDDGIIRLWNWESGEIRTTLHKHTRDVNSIAWSFDGQILASGSDDATICLWNPETGQLIYTFTEHLDSVNSIAWAPDGQILASASSDNTIRIWGLKEKRLLNTFEGHIGPIVCIAFSRTGRLLASKSLDGSVQLRQSDTGKIIARLEEPSLPYGWYSGLSFHPNAPLLATLGEKDTIIRLWKLDIDSLLGIPTIRYTNAKVALVGDSGVGKTGLSLVLTHQPYVPTDSTHGRHVWLFDSREEVDLERYKEIHETFLWDLAGQANYRLIHQLHLDQVVLALIVFDFHNDTNPFTGINYWTRVLTLVQHSKPKDSIIMKRFLVAARIDRGGRNVSHRRIEQLVDELKFAGYFETSARDSRGIAELREAIITAIDWQALPKISSTHLFQRIKDFIVDLKKRGLTLDFLENLYQVFLVSRFSVEEDEKSSTEFEICIKFMSSQGLIKQLSFGNYILLKPELLDYYASALVNAVNDESDGLGTILENKVMEGHFPIPKENRLGNEKQEKLLLTAMIEQLISHDIIWRESTNDGPCLVFPSLFTHELPIATEMLKKEVTFYFEGPVANIYATLVVRLSHSGFFGRKEAGQDVITFTHSSNRPGNVSSIYGLSLLNIGEGRGELTLCFEKDVRKDTDNGKEERERRSIFEQFVFDHLASRALPGTVQRQRIIICTACGEPFRESAVKRRQESGHKTIVCSVCETSTSISDTEEPDPAAYQSQVSAMNSAANARREDERNKTILFGESQAKVSKGEYDVFLCYNHDDWSGVEKIGKELMNRAIAPWLDMWDVLPGRSWQEEVEQQIERIPAAAVFVGKAGMGPWQEREIRAWLHEFVNRNCPVIPVLLENAPHKPDLPSFLGDIRWVDFRTPTPLPDSDFEARLEREKPLQEALELGAFLQEALELGGSIRAKARKLGLLLRAETLEPAELLQEIRELEKYLREVPKVEEQLGEVLESREQLQEALKLGEWLQGKVPELGVWLQAEALGRKKQSFASVLKLGEQIQAEALELGDRLQAVASVRKKQSLAKARKLGEQIQAEALEQEKLFQMEDPRFNQDPMYLLERGIKGKRLEV